MTKEDYKTEGLRRMRLRKQKRNLQYKLQIEKAQELGVPLYGARGGYWEDSFSPTGYSQVCSYEVYGTCQYPCNGDC
jgi:hypothetical protein